MDKSEVELTLQLTNEWQFKTTSGHQVKYYQIYKNGEFKSESFSMKIVNGSDPLSDQNFHFHCDYINEIVLALTQVQELRKNIDLA